MAGFTRQETLYSREHRASIDAVEIAGCACRDFDLRLFDCSLEELSPARRLGATIAEEHFTATISHQTIAGSCMNGDARMTVLWKWHAIEEIKHKYVCW
jgi:uncharacterized protein